MRSIQHIVICIVGLVTIAATFSNAFSPVNVRATGSMVGGSSFIVTNKGSASSSSSTYQCTAAVPVVQTQSFSRSTALYMGQMAKFGIFSPAVYVAKIALGDEKLNKIRGKAISLHSQYIGEFCEWVGAYHLRTRLIKKAKTNGDTLGFLV